MAASFEVVSEFCAICLEEFPSSRSDLDLTRPESCETHWFHRECLKKALFHNLVCPIPSCERECRVLVDQYGNKEPFRINLLDIFNGAEDNDEQDTDTVVRECALCGNLIFLDMFYFHIPCKHLFHQDCFHLINTTFGGNECPVINCHRRIAASLQWPEYSIIQYDSVLISQPEYADLQSKLGLTSAPAISSNPCCLCGEIGPGKSRVQPPCCPPSHIMHKECFSNRVDLSTICRCPFENCNREFLPASLMDLPPAREFYQGQQSQGISSSQTSCGSCCKCKKPLETDIARPNNCNHLFHRQCLVRATKHFRACPVRGCKKKFRTIL